MMIQFEVTLVCQMYLLVKARSMPGSSLCANYEFQIKTNNNNLLMFQEGLKIIQVYALSMMISYILHIGDVSALSAWGWVATLLFTGVLYIFVNAVSSHGEILIGISARTALSAIIYQKVGANFIH